MSSVIENKYIVKRRSNRKLIAAMVFCFLIVALGITTKIPFLHIIIAVYLIAMVELKQLYVSELFLIWMVLAPWMLGPSFTFDFGKIPNINFDRLVGFYLLYCTFKQKKESTHIFKNRIDKALVMIIITVAISILFCFMIRTPLRIFIDSILFPTIFFVFAKYVIKEEQFFRKMYVAASILVIILGFVGVIEILLNLDLFNTVLTSERGRANGPFTYAEYYGMVLTYLSIIILSMREYYKEALKKDRVGSIALIAGVIGITLSLTRGIWLSFFSGIMVFYIYIKKSIIFIILILMIGVIFLIGLDRIFDTSSTFYQSRLANMTTIYARIATYKSALKMISNNILVGVGYGAYTEAYERKIQDYQQFHNGVVSVRQPHNTYLAVLAETGIIGFIPFLSFFICIISVGKAMFSRNIDRRYRYYAAAVICIAIAYLVDGVGHDLVHNIGYPNKIFFFFVGMLSGLYDKTMIKKNTRPDQVSIVVGG